MLFTLPSTIPDGAKKAVAVPCPVNGRPRALDSLDDAMLRSGIWGHGAAVETASSEVFAPLEGNITRCDPLSHALVLRAKNGLILRLQLGIRQHSLMGEKCQFRVKVGDVVKKGQPLLIVSPPHFRQHRIESLCVMTVLNSDRLQALVPNLNGHCRAMEDPLFTLYV